MLSLFRWTTLWPLLLATSLSPSTLAEDRNTASAVFAAGCFWCVEEAYDKVEGVVATTSGFSGGDVANPGYDQVVTGGTGHAEVVKVEYDPDTVDYSTLLYVFWRNVDPFAENRQFCDQGASYRSALFPMNEAQRQAAEASRAEVAERFERKIATEINDFKAFYPAAEYHQDYYDKNPLRYQFYKSACGRSERLEEIWGDEAEASRQP
ncbi:peptide-methionine (S)-S-oxide reductase MsrA [Halomonas halmophila]|uniref:Peptide methionine sulfoxide reductase MsrA n=1 Tax=Halomonas halmophila TaxID=252 RepID=A0A4Y4F2B1_9GAMM|nr:peptide-methionine (S)-S-oxide reductase MsrA [Halomonas halmophila]GED21720.1 peptide methionine sulfoxide reductase MsrA [Halomonas halmophila]